jgi:hypothetical protein
VLAYAGDVNLIGNDIITIGRSACKDISLEEKLRTFQYMEVVRHQVMMTNENITVGVIVEGMWIGVG